MQEAHIDACKLIRRSKLFVPVNRKRLVLKAWTRGTDCIILDLEDAIANMKYVNHILERAEAAARREAEKTAAVQSAGGIK